ncbi:MAG: ABC transporter ATP-binding protein [Verrucomicrobiota bacterium]
MPLLELNQVCKHFGDAPVLHDVNLSVEEGDFVAIIGYSGSGKTTLVSILAGLLAPDSGTAQFDGHPISGPGPERGLVFQNYSLLPWLTVAENVALAVDQLHPDWSPGERSACTDRYVSMVNLAAARDKRPAELSGGMRQRVSVARTLAMNPRVLLLDEPLSALDALTRATLQDEIARLRREQNQTVVLITNDPDEALLLADRVIPLTRGPGATLGPGIPIPLPHPRDRRTLIHDAAFQRLRREVIASLLSVGTRPTASLTREVILPDLEPEDLSRPRSWRTRSGPLRRQERQTVTVTTPAEAD